MSDRPLPASETADPAPVLGQIALVAAAGAVLGSRMKTGGLVLMAGAALMAARRLAEAGTEPAEIIPTTPALPVLTEEPCEASNPFLGNEGEEWAPLPSDLDDSPPPAEPRETWAELRAALFPTVSPPVSIAPPIEPVSEIKADVGSFQPPPAPEETPKEAMLQRWAGLKDAMPGFDASKTTSPLESAESELRSDEIDHESAESELRSDEIDHESAESEPPSAEIEYESAESELRSAEFEPETAESEPPSAKSELPPELLALFGMAKGEMTVAPSPFSAAQKGVFDQEPWIESVPSELNPRVFHSPGFVQNASARPPTGSLLEAAPQFVEEEPESLLEPTDEVSLIASEGVVLPDTITIPAEIEPASSLLETPPHVVYVDPPTQSFRPRAPSSPQIIPKAGFAPTKAETESYTATDDMLPRAPNVIPREVKAKKSFFDWLRE